MSRDARMGRAVDPRLAVIGAFLLGAVVGLVGGRILPGATLSDVEATVTATASASGATPTATQATDAAATASAISDPARGSVTISDAPTLTIGHAYRVDLLDGANAQLSAEGQTQAGGICPMWAGRWWRLALRQGDDIEVTWTYSAPASGFYQFLIFAPDITDATVVDAANNNEHLQFVNSSDPSGAGSFSAPESGAYPFIIGNGCPSTSGPFTFTVTLRPPAS